MVLAKANAKEGGVGREATAVVFFPDRPSLMALSGGAAPPFEDPGKKTRKPYTITKSRESWTEQDHDKFLEALQLFDRDWKKIEAFVGSKTVIQIRSHAQKYFLKVQKNGTNEHVPPPRPKRKAAHPYPQKASKSVSQIPEAKTLLQSSCLLEPGYSSTRETSSILRNHTPMSVSSLVQSPAQPVSACHLSKDDIATAGVAVANNCCSSSTESPRTWPSCESIDQENLITSLHVMPDFAQVYNFLASVFDPNTSGHLQKLKAMDPIDVETVLLLMRNLSFNLTSPEFEAHRRLLSTYEGNMEEAKPHSVGNIFHPREAANTPLLVQGK
ncbi:protein REVEILLE 6-like isoform X2 [Canna indica]|uniref:Protein REVEILLE 6-like isoform X2 n=1 Tax=Canna indica TaxID=4628 RepID=A0AAQ3L1D1_9LILI|nr:protein REVEILLE 6-like isoform X2 [Canna indica]